MVFRWENMPHEKITDWEYVEEQMETLKRKIEEILSVDMQKSNKPKYEVTKKTKVTMKAVFVDSGFQINTVSDMNQTNWKQVKDKYNIIELKNYCKRRKIGKTLQWYLYFY